MKCQEYYKIGITGNPRKRLVDLQIGNPFKISLVGSYGLGNDVSSIETLLHGVVAKKRFSGEWFTLSVSEVELLDSLLREVEIGMRKVLSEPTTTHHITE